MKKDSRTAEERVTIIPPYLCVKEYCHPTSAFAESGIFVCPNRVNHES